ncbi:putative Ras GTPase-activating protein-binding protein [Helianthus annuus]|nr:putative Ras GTPase-activating protein-binding protein [Helianthus annuus]
MCCVILIEKVYSLVVIFCRKIHLDLSTELLSCSESGFITSIRITSTVYVDGYSVYIKGLPMNATPALLEKEFKKFGPITPNGIQVRNNMGFCFRFVEFEVPDAVQKAIQVRRQSRSMDAMLLLRKHARQTHMQLDYMWQMDWLMG